MSVLKTQLAAKGAALAELEALADGAFQSAEQAAALRSELARRTHQLADQAQALLALRDKVRSCGVFLTLCWAYSSLAYSCGMPHIKCMKGLLWPWT